MKKTVNRAATKDIPPKPGKKEIKLQESPLERALRLSSEEIIALAIRDLIKKDELN